MGPSLPNRLLEDLGTADTQTTEGGEVSRGLDYQGILKTSGERFGVAGSLLLKGLPPSCCWQPKSMDGLGPTVCDSRETQTSTGEQEGNPLLLLSLSSHFYCLSLAKPNRKAAGKGA